MASRYRAEGSHRRAIHLSAWKRTFQDFRRRMVHRPCSQGPVTTDRAISMDRAQYQMLWCCIDLRRGACDGGTRRRVPPGHKDGFLRCKLPFPT